MADDYGVDLQALRAQRRYGKRKMPAPTTAELVAARDKLRKGLEDQKAADNDESASLQQRDGQRATRESAARGDYNAGGSYQPFRPGGRDQDGD